MPAAESVMAGGEGKRDSVVIDLDEIIERWAWSHFCGTRETRKEKRLRRENVEMTINWKNAKFEHQEPKYTPLSSGSTDSMKPKTQVLFRTQFCNNTDGDQEYSFKTSRTTSSACSVAVERGVTNSLECSFGLKTPCEILEVGGSFSREISVTTTTEQTIQEDVTWEVDNQIKVPPGCTTTAELKVDERTEKRSYSITSFFYGAVQVELYKRKDNSYITSVGNNLFAIIKKSANPVEKTVLKLDETKCLLSKPVVTYETKGTCTFSYGVEQRVDLSQTPLKVNNVAT